MFIYSYTASCSDFGDIPPQLSTERDRRNLLLTITVRYVENTCMTVQYSTIIFHLQMTACMTPYDYKVELTGVGNRSQINADDNIEI